MTALKAMLDDALAGMERRAMIDARAQVRAELESAWTQKFEEAKRFNDEARAFYAQAQALLADVTAAVKSMQEYHDCDDEDEANEAAEEAKEDQQIDRMQAIAASLSAAVAKIADTQKQLASYKPTPAPVTAPPVQAKPRTTAVVFDVVDRDANGAIKTISIRP